MDLKPIFAEEAKKRMSEGGKHKGSELIHNPGRASDKVAKAMQISGRYVDEAEDT